MLYYFFAALLSVVVTMIVGVSRCFYFFLSTLRKAGLWQRKAYYVWPETIQMYRVSFSASPKLHNFIYKEIYIPPRLPSLRLATPPFDI